MRRQFSTGIQIKKDAPALFTISAGLLAGFIHVLIGPDHLAALAPMAADQRHRAWITGFRWGIGHSTGVLLVGMLVLIFREIIPVNLISTYSERVVGVVLIAIGIWALRKTMNQHVHTHPHSHDGKDHVHIHMHTSVPKHRHTHAALAVGALHGLAGSSHIFGILPALHGHRIWHGSVLKPYWEIVNAFLFKYLVFIQRLYDHMRRCCYINRWILVDGVMNPNDSITCWHFTGFFQFCAGAQNLI